jgi:type I restriction enzyme S subunit
MGMGREWRTVSLGDLFRVKHGFAFKSEYFTDEPQDTVLVTPGNFAIGGGFQDGKRKYYNGRVPEDYVLKPGQVVVTMTDLSKESDTLGYAASIPNDSTIWLHNQRVGLLEFKTEIPTSPRFIEYLLRTHEYRSWIVGSATGTTVKHTAPGRIESFATRIPPIEEQRAIAHILGTLDDKIELNRKQNETLEAMASALFKAWFVDFEPVRAKLEGRWQRGQSLPGLPAHLYDLFPDRLVDSELGEIPEGWEVTSVDVEFDVTMGQSPPGNTYNETGEGLPFYQGRTDFEFRFPKRRIYCTAPTRLAKKGDTLVSVRAPVGDINMASEDCAIGRGVAAVRHKMGRRSYTYQFMRSISDVFARFNAEGTVFGSIGKKDFHSIAHVKPPRDLVLAFENWAAQPDDQIERNERESRTLVQLRDILLPKLISGELRIKDAEKFIEAAQ